MLGLRKRENEKFERYFELVQEAAAKDDAVFFADAGTGRGCETAEMEAEEMFGWLIPKNLAEEFKPGWKVSDILPKFDDYFKWAEWKRDGDKITVYFED